MTKVFKTCNCCLDRNKRPALMGVRAKVKYCRHCHMTTIWGEADAGLVATTMAAIARRETLLEELLAE